MTNFLAALKDLAEELRRSHAGSPAIRFHMGPTDRPKRSAWLEAEDQRISAQVTVWVSGECEAEADSVVDGAVLIRESRVISDAHELRSVVEKVMKVFDGEPNSPSVST